MNIINTQPDDNCGINSITGGLQQLVLELSTNVGTFCNSVHDYIDKIKISASAECHFQVKQWQIARQEEGHWRHFQRRML